MSTSKNGTVSPHEYRIRLDDSERILIVEALADHLYHRVRRAKRWIDIESEVELLDRLTNPAAHKPSMPWWARHWDLKHKRDVYRELRALRARALRTVTLEPNGTVTNTGDNDE